MFGSPRPARAGSALSCRSWARRRHIDGLARTGMRRPRPWLAASFRSLAQPSNTAMPMMAPRIGPHMRSQLIGGPACRTWCVWQTLHGFGRRDHVDQHRIAREHAGAEPRRWLARSSARLSAASVSCRASTGDRRVAHRRRREAPIARAAHAVPCAARSSAKRSSPMLMTCGGASSKDDGFGRRLSSTLVIAACIALRSTTRHSHRPCRRHRRRLRPAA